MMRIGELLGLPVLDADGTSRGKVLDVRARVERAPGAPPALVVDGLLVGTRRWRLFGYEHRGEQGPAVFRAVFRLLHHHIRYVVIDRVHLVPGKHARLAVPWQELPPPPELPH